MTDLSLSTDGTIAPAGAAVSGASRVSRMGAVAAGAEAEVGVGARNGVEARNGGGSALAEEPVGASGGVCSGAGSTARVVGLLDELVVALRSLGGDLVEERLGLLGRCEARLAGVKSETVAALARRDGDAQAAEAVRSRLRSSRGVPSAT